MGLLAAVHAAAYALTIFCLLSNDRKGRCHMRVGSSVEIARGEGTRTSRYLLHREHSQTISEVIMLTDLSLLR